MAKLTSEEIRTIKRKLENKFHSHGIEPLGSNRYAIIEPQLPVPMGSIFPPYKKYKLSDEEGNLINLGNEYDAIFRFTKGVAIVRIKEKPEIINSDSGDKSDDKKKEGLIDINGKELLPCLFDSIYVRSDGFLEIIKDGMRETTNASKILSGEFDWEKSFQKQ